MTAPVEATAPTRTPRNAIVILLDSLNRRRKLRVAVDTVTDRE